MTRRQRANLTTRQLEVLDMLRLSQVTGSDGNGSVLRALETKGYVLRNHFSQGQNTYYTWTLTDEGRNVEKFYREVVTPGILKPLGAGKGE